MSFHIRVIFAHPEDDYDMFSIRVQLLLTVAAVCSLDCDELLRVEYNL